MIKIGNGYAPPVGGIPSTDLSAAVQTSLAKANAATRDYFQAIRALNLRQVGFNQFSAVQMYFYGQTDAQVIQLFDYAVSCGANCIRIMYPCFSAAEYTTYVLQGAPSASITDAAFKATFLAWSDKVFDLAAARGIKLMPCVSWYDQAVNPLFSESYPACYATTSTQTVAFMVNFSSWFANRYKDHPAMGIYTIGNEYAHEPAGVTKPTPAQLSAVFKVVADAIRSVDPAHIVTADLLAPPVSTVLTRDTLETYIGYLRTIFTNLDAWNVHVYANDTGYVGRVAADGYAPAPANTLGYENLDALLSAIREAAHSQGKPFIIGEYGIPTDIEADTANLRKIRQTRIVKQHSDLALIWNLQLGGHAAANQTKWFIENGTTRGNTFAAVVTPENAGAYAGTSYGNRYKGGGTAQLLTKKRPANFFSCSRSVNGFVSFTSQASLTASAYALMAWVKIDAATNSFEVMSNFRGAGNASGFVLTSSGSGGGDYYADFRGATGSAGNSNAMIPAQTVGQLHHIAIVYGPVASGNAVEIWLNGILWQTRGASAVPIVGIPVGTTCIIGGNTSGAPVTLQDFAILAGAGPEDIWAHMDGEVNPAALLHVRALGNGQLVDMSRYANTLTVGSAVATSRQ